MTRPFVAAAALAAVALITRAAEAEHPGAVVDEGQHELSHEPNSNAAAHEKLTRINAWRAGEFAHEPHNRLLLAIAHAMGHVSLERFGNPDFCGLGPLAGLA